MTYRVVYSRVGRRGGRDGSAPPPALTVRTGPSSPLADIADAVHRDVRQYLASSGYDVIVSFDEMRGSISAGFRTVGEFAIELAGAEA